MLLTSFENLNFTSNIFPETHDFLVLTDLGIIFTCYEPPTDIPENVRHPTSKVTKIRFGPNIKYLLESFFASLVILCYLSILVNSLNVFCIGKLPPQILDSVDC